MALTKNNKIILFTMALFIILSPGVLLTIPAGKGSMLMGLSKKGGACATSYAAIVVHALLFAIVFKLAYDKYFLPETKIETAEEIKEAVRRRRRRRRRRR